MNRLISVALLALASITVACSQPITDLYSVVGRYQLNKGDAEDVITVRADGSYIHAYRPRFGSQVVDTARWTLKHEGGDVQIEFEKFSHYSRTEFFPGEQILRGFWIVDIEKNWRGQIRMAVDTDIGLYYIRN